MKKIILPEFLFIAFSFLNAMQVHSQSNFIYRAALGAVKETKFYKIDLPPWLVAKCKPGLEDIRIFDEHGKQVSYILKNDLPVFNKAYVTEFPIIKSAKEKDRQTHIILQNITGKAVNNLVLFIKNAEARRVFSISGSDDGINWFIIKESVYLDNPVNNTGENITQLLSFPSAVYKYFQLTILGENVLPFSIEKAGIYNEDISYGKYVKVPAATLFQKDSSDKKSYVWLKFNDKYQINKLAINAEGSKYFNRKLLVLDNNKPYNNIILNDYLGSSSFDNFILKSNSDRLLIIIDNEDNVPLKISRVEAFQLNISLLTYLQAANNYHIYFGDSTVQAPVYDLQYFSDSVEKDPSPVFLKGIEVNKILPLNRAPTAKNNQLILWIIIAAILTGLCFFTFKMIKEVDAKKKNT